MSVDVGELWSRLTVEGNFELLSRLRRAECREPGFCTIVVGKTGFSEDDETHNMVIDFLKQIDVHVFNPGLEATKLEMALHGEYYEV